MGQPTPRVLQAAFGHDAIGSVGTPTTITSTDVDGILLIAIKAIELRTEEPPRENALLRAAIEGCGRRASSVREVSQTRVGVGLGQERLQPARF